MAVAIQMQPRYIAASLLTVWLLAFLFFYTPSGDQIIPLKSAPGVAPSATSVTLSTLPTKQNKERTLITYVYFESDLNRRNLIFFLNHGLHDKADFIIILNGVTKVQELFPEKARAAKNVRVVNRPNSCYDLGAHSEVLQTDALWTRYRKFILMNASVRGPFMPTWSNSCWSDRFLAKVTDETKLVGLSLNCWPAPHVQSMVWATDIVGMSLLLQPPPTSPNHNKYMERLFSHAADFPRPADYAPQGTGWVEKGLAQCFKDRLAAVEMEIGATGIILAAGKKVDVMLTKFQTTPNLDVVPFCNVVGDWDPTGDNTYDGTTIHPFETVFIKTNRGLSPVVIENLSQWTDQLNYTSYDYCK